MVSERPICQAMDTEHPLYGKGWGHDMKHCTKPAEVKGIDTFTNAGFALVLCEAHARSMNFLPRGDTDAKHRTYTEL